MQEKGKKMVNCQTVYGRIMEENVRTRNKISSKHNYKNNMEQTFGHFMEIKCNKMAASIEK